MRQHAGTRVTSILDGANAILGEGSRIPDGGTKLPAELAIASEGALTLIGASFNKPAFPAILRSRRRPMQEASAYGASRPFRAYRRTSAHPLTAGVRLWRQELVFMPRCRHSLDA